MQLLILKDQSRRVIFPTYSTPVFMEPNFAKTIFLFLFIAFEIECLPDDFSMESSSGWSQWSNWAPCSRSCDRGLRYRLRRCFDLKCQGPGIQHKVCQEQSCHESKADMYKKRCSAAAAMSYPDIPAEYLEIIELPQNPCTLVCKLWMHGKVVKYHAHIVDGASCYNDENHVCLDGHCLKLGCDGIVNSAKQFDVCGVCDGNGLTCGRATYVWKETDQYSECDTTCGMEAWQVSTSICVNKKTTEWVPDEYCVDKPRPTPTLKRCAYVPCPAGWITGKWEDCDKPCGGGWQKREVFCIEYHNDTNGKVETRYLKSGYCWDMKKPAEKQRCNQHSCPGWEVGEWSKCSASCAQGLQYRRVVCRQGTDKEVSNSFCDQKTMPAEQQTCNTGVSCEEVELSQKADYERYLSVIGKQSEQKERENTAMNAQSYIKPNWMAGAWKPCSETCGLGVQNRDVQCVAFQMITQNIVVLPEYECDPTTKPQEFQPCEVDACPQQLPMRNPPQSLPEPERSLNEYRWDFSEWGPCSASCLGGTQSITLRCVNVQTTAEVAWANCNAKQRPANLTRTCNNHPCPARWEVGNWSVCSHSCGGGLRTRRIRCVKDINRSSKSVRSLVMPEDQCPPPKPAGRQACAMGSCPPRWVVGPWSECSVTCGPGEQYRAIECEQVVVGGGVKRYDPPTPCTDLTRPPTIQLCSLAGSCPPVGRQISQSIGTNKFMSTTKNTNRRRLTLRVGGQATLFEGTNLKIKCPASGTTEHSTKWFKNSVLIIKSDRVHVSKNGALRINSASYKDAGVYTCMVDQKRRNITLMFKPRKQGRKGALWSRKQKTSKNETKANRTPSWLNYTNLWTPAVEAEVVTVVPVRVAPDLQKANTLKTNKFQTRQGKLNRGGSVETNQLNERDVTITEDQLKDGAELEDSYEDSYISPKSLFEELKESLRARGALHVYQLLTNEESLASVRFAWVTGIWSPCSKRCQTDATSGMQFRSVQCKVDIDGRSAYVDDNICVHAKLNKPYESQFCGMEPCPEWFADEWNECADSRCVRFSTAVQRRAVHCRMPNGTDAVSQDLCDRHTKPKQKKECFNKNCVAEWRASEWLPCSKSCGTVALQMRVVNCVWHRTHKPAGNSCSSSLRPVVSRLCENLPPCPEGDHEKWKILKDLKNCTETSKFCPVVKMLALCDAADYKDRCCITCSIDHLPI